MGVYTPYSYFYLPALGAHGTIEKGKYDAALIATDAYIHNLVASVNATTIYLGEPVTDGTWRFTVVGANLSVQRRESGAWVEKALFLA